MVYEVRGERLRLLEKFFPEGHGEDDHHHAFRSSLDGQSDPRPGDSGPRRRRHDLPGGVELDTSPPGPEHRSFPRARLRVPFRVWIGEGTERRFSATLGSRTSASAAPSRSTFFLPVANRTDGALRARAEGSRRWRRGPRCCVRSAPTTAQPSGMGLRFLEFFKQTEVTLARALPRRTAPALRRGLPADGPHPRHRVGAGPCRRRARGLGVAQGDRAGGPLAHRRSAGAAQDVASDGQPAGPHGDARRTWRAAAVLGPS